MQQQNRTKPNLINRLLQEPSWKKLSFRSQEELLEKASVHEVARGGQIDAQAGILLKGTVAIRQPLNDGRRVLCTLYHEGDWFDLRRENRLPQGQLIALNDTVFIALNTHVLDGCITHHLDAAALLFREAREQLARQCDHTTDVTVKTAVERIASILFEMKRWPESLCEPGEQPTIHMPIQKADIAAYMGMKPETVSRAFKSLEDQQLIAMPNRCEVQITMASMLRRVANGSNPTSMANKRPALAYG